MAGYRHVVAGQYSGGGLAAVETNYLEESGLPRRRWSGELPICRLP